MKPFAIGMSFLVSVLLIAGEAAVAAPASGAALTEAAAALSRGNKTGPKSLAKPGAKGKRAARAGEALNSSAAAHRQVESKLATQQANPALQKEAIAISGAGELSGVQAGKAKQGQAATPANTTGTLSLAKEAPTADRSTNTPAKQNNRAKRFFGGFEKMVEMGKANHEQVEALKALEARYPNSVTSREILGPGYATKCAEMELRHTEVFLSMIESGAKALVKNRKDLNGVALAMVSRHQLDTGKTYEQAKKDTCALAKSPCRLVGSAALKVCNM